MSNHNIFKAESESINYTREGKAWESTGDTLSVLGACLLGVKTSTPDLLQMAADILLDQMNRMDVGDTRAYNWACTVLNVKVTRLS